MSSTEIVVHMSREKMPGFFLASYRNPKFTSIKLVIDEKSSIVFYVDSLQDVVNFKNNCLHACEAHIARSTP